MALVIKLHCFRNHRRDRGDWCAEEAPPLILAGIRRGKQLGCDFPGVNRPRQGDNRRIRRLAVDLSQANLGQRWDRQQVPKNLPGPDRRQLIKVADQDDPGFGANRAQERRKQGQTGHRHFIDDQ